MKYYVLEPEVAGGFGPKLILDRHVRPASVTKFHYEFDVWLGAPLLEAVGCFSNGGIGRRILDTESDGGFLLSGRGFKIGSVRRPTARLPASEICLAASHRQAWQE